MVQGCLVIQAAAVLRRGTGRGAFSDSVSREGFFFESQKGRSERAQDDAKKVEDEVSSDVENGNCGHFTRANTQLSTFQLLKKDLRNKMAEKSRGRALLVATAIALLPTLAMAFSPSAAPVLRSGVSSLQCSVRATDSGSDRHPVASTFRAVGAPLVGFVGAAITLLSPLAAVSDVAVVAPVPVFRLAAVTLPTDWSTAVTDDGKE